MVHCKIISFAVKLILFAIPAKFILPPTILVSHWIFDLSFMLISPQARSKSFCIILSIIISHQIILADSQMFPLINNSPQAISKSLLISPLITILPPAITRSPLVVVLRFIFPHAT
jgi:hypothetical protein